MSTAGESATSLHDVLTVH